MSLEGDDLVNPPSYFWSCITFSDECPFFTTIDPKLWYFGMGLAILYGAFILMILCDLGFYWSLDNFHYQIDYCIKLVQNKVERVKKDQRRLMSARERTEKQLKRSEQSKRMVTLLRGALLSDNPQQFKALTGFTNSHAPDVSSEWSPIDSYVNY